MDGSMQHIGYNKETMFRIDEIIETLISKKILPGWKYIHNSTCRALIENLSHNFFTNIPEYKIL